MASRYPDGSTRHTHNQDPEMRRTGVVVLPTRVDASEQFKVPVNQVSKIVCCRRLPKRDVQYLVRWKTEHDVRAFSWHTSDELSDCLPKLQKYLNKQAKSRETDALLSPATHEAKGRKRKTPEYEESPSSVSGENSLPGSPRSSWDADADAYGCTVERKNGLITFRPVGQSAGTSPREAIPTTRMRVRAASVYDRVALYQIRTEFNSRVACLVEAENGVSISVHSEDGTVPSLNFEFITRSRLGRGVEPSPQEALLGCGNKHAWSTQQCRPFMGQMTDDGEGIGCEYPRVCDCLEFAAVDESRLKDEDRQRMQDDPEDRMGLPKRFPYVSPTASSRQGCLVPFYLDSRHPIYECNRRCPCGPACRTRVVQKGRQVPLEIFKTAKKGWGLRCTEDLAMGQFIDTYRGEIITNEEADRREAKMKKGRAIYLYTLDKFIGEGGLELDECFVVDGEKMSGPTRFINHSCDPNCQQHTVSYNKYDTRVYELAFFANRDIPAGTELTFDYLDKDEAETQREEHEGEGMECHCGSRNPLKPCRGRLFI